MKRAFTLMELMISMAIAFLLAAGVYAVLQIGGSFYHNEQGHLVLQQDLRNAVQIMSREMRQASRGNTTITTGTILFDIPDESDIQYYLNDENALTREDASGETTTVANNIESITFSPTGSPPASDLITIQIAAEKEVAVAAGWRTLNANLTEKVQMRND